MATDWKIELCLYDCDGLYDDMINKDWGVFVDMPSAPSKGDVVWPDDKTQDELNYKARDCWKRNHCKDCPYLYGWKKSVNDIDTCDYIHVVSRIYDVEKKTVKIGLSNSSIDD